MLGFSLPRTTPTTSLGVTDGTGSYKLHKTSLKQQFSALNEESYFAKWLEVETTSLRTGSLDQNLHQDPVPSACEGEGSGSANFSSCEASKNFSFQLRGTHPLLTRIGKPTLQEAIHDIKIEETWKN